MNADEELKVTKARVGIFSLLAIGIVIGITVFVNSKPYWWKHCSPIEITVEDATGIKSNAAVKTLGIHIGYLKNIDLKNDGVILGICITARVEMLPETKAYIRGEGFLGDKFIELKPVKYAGPAREVRWNFNLINSAYAEEKKQIAVGQSNQDMTQTVEKVNSLVTEISGLTTSLKETLNPAELKKTLQQLNTTLEHAGQTLSPRGNLTSAAQRSISKLEDAIDQVRDQLTKINQGKGSVGMLLNDPTYAEEIKVILKKASHLVGKVDEVQFIVNAGFDYLGAWDSTRGWFKLAIWPNTTRYYLAGVAVDPRGRYTGVLTTTTVGSVSQSSVQNTLDPSSLVFIAMLGKVVWKRIDGSVGILYNDFAISLKLLLGPSDNERMFSIENDTFSRFQGLNASGSTVSQIDNRTKLVIKPMDWFYISGGLESVRQLNGRLNWLAGAGISFNDEDIKILFSLM
ncbi:MAG: MCE family protein [Xanthomonadaceae bacterium]|nr:MCE family protein [Xanthomonadaceae bacterium]